MQLPMVGALGLKDPTWRPHLHSRSIFDDENGDHMSADKVSLMPNVIQNRRCATRRESSAHDIMDVGWFQLLASKVRANTSEG